MSINQNTRDAKSMRQLLVENQGKASSNVWPKNPNPSAEIVSIGSQKEMVCPKETAIYDGTFHIDPEKWLKRFEQLAKSKNWCDEEKIESLEDYGSEKAAQWYDICVDGVTDWNECRELFLDEFSEKVREHGTYEITDHKGNTDIFTLHPELRNFKEKIESLEDYGSEKAAQWYDICVDGVTDWNECRELFLDEFSEKVREHGTYEITDHKGNTDIFTLHPELRNFKVNIESLRQL
ncbi:hypothetical protein BB561_001440 [Smittium simulii]|uniref:Uncharacterized protein n=1 Tax=Smittium simulii TaxID=133385 RepID=A0A2T9YUU3_9FUNG|nr:hypothetical protein BB561_001440 [Smittium simulii]